MKKLFHKIHLWLSIPIGLIIVVVCLTGAILVFEDEINEWTNPTLYFSENVHADPLPLGEFVAKANKQLDGKTVTSVQIPAASNRNYSVSFEGGGRTSAYFDPYTGELQGFSQRAKGFTGFMFRLHRWLLDGSRTVGKAIVGYSTLLFVVILITGFILWWPKSKKQLKSRLQVKTKNGKRRFWFDMHTSVGFYVGLGLILLSLTGLHYSFDWYRNGLYKVLGVETTIGERNTASQPGKQANGRGEQKQVGTNNQGEKGEEQTQTIHVEQWEQVLAALKLQNPKNKAITLSDGSATVTHLVKFGNPRASDRYTFHVLSGEITDTVLYKDQPRATKVRGWIYALHVGSWGGLLSKILTCIVSLAGASLALTGYYVYFAKRKKKVKPKRKFQ